jgi:V/A-type H+-transporting ATPase subunit E
MAMLETGEEKIQQICDAIRKETLEPALRDAQVILDEAALKAENILTSAQAQAESMLAQARATIEQERNVFQSSLAQAVKQSLESLRQCIENKLFSEQLQEVIDKPASNPKVIADLINSIVKSIEKEGLATDISAQIAKNVPPQEVNQLLLEGVVKRLKNNSVDVGDFKGGAKVTLKGRNMTIDISDQALKELLSAYVRKDFRTLIFNTP